jgi:pilus assembly protein Flp/PilA
MTFKIRAWRHALNDESGQNMVEYALVLGLIALGCVAAMNGLASSIGTGLGSVGTNLTTYTS